MPRHVSVDPGSGPLRKYIGELAERLVTVNSQIALQEKDEDRTPGCWSSWPRLSRQKEVDMEILLDRRHDLTLQMVDAIKSWDSCQQVAWDTDRVWATPSRSARMQDSVNRLRGTNLFAGLVRVLGFVPASKVPLTDACISQLLHHGRVLLLQHGEGACHVPLDSVPWNADQFDRLDVADWKARVGEGAKGPQSYTVPRLPMVLDHDVPPMSPRN